MTSFAFFLGGAHALLGAADPVGDAGTALVAEQVFRDVPAMRLFSSPTRILTGTFIVVEEHLV